MAAEDSKGATSVVGEAFKVARELSNGAPYAAALSRVMSAAGMPLGQACELSQEEVWRRASDIASKKLAEQKASDNIEGALRAMGGLIAVHALDSSRPQVLRDKTCVEVARSGVEHFRARRDRRGEAAATHLLIVLLLETQQHKQALQVLEGARQSHKDLGDVGGEVRALSAAVAAFTSRGELPAAMALAGELFALCLSSQDQAGQADALVLTANIHLLQASLDKAAEVARDALGIAREIGDGRVELRALEMLFSVQLANRRGGAEKAAALAEEMLQVARDQQASDQEATALFALARLRAAAAGTATGGGAKAAANTAAVAAADAARLAREAVEVLEDLGDKKAQLPILEFLYTCQSNMGEHMMATHTAKDIYAIMEDLQNPHGAANALILAAEAEPRTMEALASAKDAARLFEAMGDIRGQAVALHLLFKAHFVQKRLQEARAAAEESLQLFRKLGGRDLRGEAVCENAVANCMLQSAHSADTTPDRAVELCQEASQLARGALEKFEALGDNYGTTLSVNILRDMKQLYDAHVGQAEDADGAVDVLGLPLGSPDQMKSLAKPRPMYKKEVPEIPLLDVNYQSIATKEPPQPSDEHKQLLIVGGAPNLFRAMLRARPGLAGEALGRLRRKREGWPQPPRGPAQPQRLVSEDHFQRQLQEGCATGVVVNAVDQDSVSSLDFVDMCLKTIRSAQQAVGTEPIPLDVFTTSQTSCRPEYNLQQRFPIHGGLVGLFRGLNNESMFGPGLFFFDVDPPHKRSLVPQIYYRRSSTWFREVVIREGHMYTPRLVGSGAQPLYPMKFEFVEK